jgi:hypothetical protein
MTPQPDGKANVTLHVHLAFPPTQEHLAEITDKLRKGVRTICDATEGKVLVNNIVLGHNGQSANDADVFWFAGNYLGRYNSSGAYFGADDARVRVDDGTAARTIAHELGHALFGLRDQYNRQRDTNNGIPQCGYGPSVEKPLTGSNSSMMQEYYTFCAEVGQIATVSPPVYCNTDSDCIAHDPTWRCSEFSEISSEFNRPTNWETVTGQGPFPGERPGEKLWLSARFHDNVSDQPAIWNRGYKWNDYIRDTGQGLNVYGIEFVDVLGQYEDEDGSQHFVYLRAQKNALSPNTYDLQASVDDADFAAKLSWIVSGVDDLGVPQNVETETLQLLKGGTSGCGPDPMDPLNYPMVKVAGLSNSTVKLKLLGSQLGEGLADVLLDVDLQDVCYRDSNEPGYFALNEGTFDPTTGEGSGTYIGRTATGGQGAPSSEAVYQQLYDCLPADAGTRWRADRQQFAESYAYEWWNNKKNNIYDTIQADCQDDPGGCGDIEFPSTGSDSDLLTLNLGTYWPVLARKAGDTFDPIELDLGAQSVSAPPISCQLFEPEIDDEAITDVDTVAMLVDRSGSMASEWTHMGNSRPRYEWARAAATAFGQAGETAAIPMFLRFATFNDEEPKLGTYFGRLATNVAVNPRVTSSQIRMMATVQPQGGTAIGGAVQYAFESMFDDPGNTGNAVYILTDGESNTGPDPAEVAQMSSIPVYVAPIGGYDPAVTTLDALANAAGGQLYSVPSADEVPANMFEMRADLRGEDLSLFQEKSSLAYGNPDKNYSIEVEPGADRLVVMVNPQHASKASWTPDFTLTGPQGESVTELSAQYVTVDAHGFYSLIMVPQPSAGNWSLVLHSPPTTGHPTRHQIAMAHIEHVTYDAPRCRVSTSTRSVSDALDQVTITAEAEYQGLVGEGATFTAKVRRPDDSIVPVAMVQQSDGRAEGVFSTYSHDGIYRATVDCSVPDGAEFARGEHLGPDDSDEPTEAKLVLSGFARVGADYFVVSAGLSLWGEGTTCARNELDRDGDGTPDACDSDQDNDFLPDVMEDAGDFDGDGVGNLFDFDSDDDGESDGRDWLSSDPTDYRRYSFGDFNGDGVDDIVHGVPEGYETRGQIVVGIAGESEEIWHQNSVGVLEISGLGDEFGTAVAVGDFDADGYDDIAVGVPGEDYNALSDVGAVNILYGSSTGITELGDQLWREGLAGVQGTAEAGDGFGARLAVGDFNCDGYDDLVIGTPDEAITTNAAAGAVHVIYGSAGGLSSANDLWYQGNSGVNGSSEAGDRFGDSLIVADFNNDSCSDLVIGAPREDWGGGVDAGNAYAIYGSLGGLTTTGDWTIVQGVVAGVPQTNDYFAERMWTRKHNADEYDDLVIMVPGECAAPGEKQKGFHYINGSSSGLTTTGQEWFCRTSWR